MKKKLVIISLVLMMLISLGITFTQKTEVCASRQIISVEDGDRGYLAYAVENGEAIFLRYDCFDERIKEYLIPSEIDGYKVTAISSGAFENSQFEKITIPNTVMTIGSYAFGGYGAMLKELVIPDSVTSIEEYFCYSPTLEKVVIGNGLKEIPGYSFSGCTSLKSVTIGSNVEVIGEGAFDECSSLKNITIPSKVKTIEMAAFSRCTSLESITIPDSVTSMGDSIFFECTSLKTAVIGNGLEELPSNIFAGASSLSKVVLGNNIKGINDWAFGNCTSLKDINYPTGLKTIGSGAFADCSSLENLVISDNVESIGASAFSGCTSLPTVVVGSRIRKLEDGVFFRCNSLVSVTLKSGLTEIGENAFQLTSALKEISIPNSVTAIGKEAFAGSGIESITLGNNLRRIEEGTFRNCPNLKSVNIPDSVTYIGESAFDYDMALETVVIGNGVEEIAKWCFRDCKALKSATIGSGVKKIGNAAFSGCSSLETIKLYEGLTTIGSSAFSGCKSLLEITIPNTVTEINEWAFGSCTSLKEIKIPNSVTQISAYLFSGCTSLEKVDLGYCVKTIEDSAFSGCKNLKELYIPKSVTAFMNSPFSQSGITDIIYAGTESQWEQIYNYLAAYHRADTVTVHFGSKTDKESTVTTKTGSVYLRKAVVYKNLNDMTNPKDDYVICTEASVYFEGNEYFADEKGIVPLPTSNRAVVVSAPGYRTEFLEYSDYMSGIGIFLEKETDLPIIKSVKLGIDEIRRSTNKFSPNKSDQFKVGFDLNGHSDCEVYIENGANKWPIYSDGYSANVPIGQDYNKWNGCRIVIKMADGRLIYKWLDTGFTSRTVQNPQLSFGTDFRDLGSNTIPYLDTLKFDFSIPNFPFDVTISGDKVVATLGVDVTKWEYSGEKGEWDNQYNAHKALAKVLENSYKRMQEDSEEYTNLIKSIGSAKKSGVKSKFGFEANLSVLGYFEATITDKGVYIDEGGLFFAFETETSKSGHGIIMAVSTPVPYYWEVAFKSELEAKLNLVQEEEYSDEMTPDGILEAELKLDVKGGPGIEDAHVVLLGEAKLNPVFEFADNSTDFKLDATVAVFVETVVGPYEYKDLVVDTSLKLYPKEEKTASEIGLFSAEEFKVINRDYLDAPSRFVANEGINLLAENEVSENVLKTNTFKVSTPQMADLGSGKRLVVWVDDDIDADAVNGRTIMYSYYDGSNWSDEQFVDQNGMGAFNPQVKKVGENTYLVWESVKTVLTDSSSLEDMLRNKEIKYAVFNESTGAFENITSLTDNGYLDSNPVISDLNDTAVITWVGNTTSDIFTANRNNSISYAVINGTTVEKTEIAKDGLNSIDSHIATGSAENAEIIYITDNEIYSSCDDSPITSDGSAKSGLQMVDGTVYYYSNGKLIKGTAEDTGITLPDDKFIITGENNTVVYLDRNGTSSDVYAYFYDETEESYGKPVKLTDMEGFYLEDISGFESSEGELVLAFNKRHITGDFEENITTLYGQSDLSTVTITPACDITLDFTYADVNSIMPGYDTIIEADITNNGSKTVNSVNVALHDLNGNLIVSSDETITLLPGESGTVELVYSVPDDFTGFAGKVTVSINGDSNTGDNTREISLVCRDIAVSNLRSAANENGTYTLYADVTNNSLTSENNVKIQLMNKDMVVGEQVIDSIGKLERTVLVFDNVEPGHTYTVVAKQLENETMVGNNDEFITLASVSEEIIYKIEGVTLNTTGEKISIEADVSVNKSVTEDTMLIVALYNSKGALVSSKTIPVNFNNETIKSVTDSMNICEYDDVKIMLWDAECSPLTEFVK